MVYRSDVFQPRLLGTEYTENYNSMICGMYKESTVKGFLIIVWKLFRIWKWGFDGGIKLERAADGLASTLNK